MLELRRGVPRRSGAWVPSPRLMRAPRPARWQLLPPLRPFPVGLSEKLVSSPSGGKPRARAAPGFSGEAWLLLRSLAVLSAGAALPGRVTQIALRAARTVRGTVRGARSFRGAGGAGRSEQVRALAGGGQQPGAAARWRDRALGARARRGRVRRRVRGKGWGAWATGCRGLGAGWLAGAESRAGALPALRGDCRLAGPGVGTGVGARGAAAVRVGEGQGARTRRALRQGRAAARPSLGRSVSTWRDLM